MTLPPQKFREITFQLLYSEDHSPIDEKVLTALLMKELSVSKKSVRTAINRMRQIRNHMEAIDEKIGITSKSYDLSRIHTVERNVLRLSVYELLFDEAIPPKVAIAEANRLAKKFGSPEAVSFVNAIMNAIYKQEMPTDETAL